MSGAPMWYHSPIYARNVLRDIVEFYGEAFVIEFLEDRLAKPGDDKGPIKPGDEVRVLPRKPGQRAEHPMYMDEMTQLEGRTLTVTGVEIYGNVQAGNWWWHPDWLEKVDG